MFTLASPANVYISVSFCLPSFWLNDYLDSTSFMCLDFGLITDSDSDLKMTYDLVPASTYSRPCIANWLSGSASYLFLCHDK